jgi:O-antigen ligase
MSLDRIAGVRSLIQYVQYFLIYLLGTNILNTKKKNMMMIIAILASTPAPLFIGLWQAIHITGNLETFGFNRIYSTAMHPNIYAYYLMIMLIFVITICFYVESFTKKLVLFLFLIPLLASLILTYSRGAWLGFSFGIGVFILMLIRRLPPRTALPLLVMTFIMGGTVYFFIQEIMQRLFEITVPGMGTFGWRMEIWRIYFQEFLKCPFWGYGLGSSSVKAGEKFGYYIAVHNNYLKFLLETGIFGLIAYIALIFALLKISLRSYIDNPGTKKAIIASGLVALICSFSLSQFGEVIEQDIIFTYFWSFLTVGYSVISEA